jgi:hypothetical protein
MQSDFKGAHYPEAARVRLRALSKLGLLALGLISREEVLRAPFLRDRLLDCRSG